MLFDKFKGIQAEREISAREKSSLEHLIEVGENCAKDDAHHVESLGDDAGDADALKFLQDGYAFAEKALEDVHFTDEDIRSYILAMSNKDATDSEQNEPLAVAYGKYISILLQLLTERNHVEGKRTRFHIDGLGSKFDGLFAFLRNIDCVYAENFNSTAAFSGAGCLDGDVNILIAKNITGAALYGEIARKGKANLVIAKNIEGDFTFMNEGENVADLIIADNLKGDGYNGVLQELGRKGRIGMIIARNIEAESVLEYAGSGQGKIGVIAGINIKAKQAFCDMGSKSHGPEGSLPQGYVGTILYENVKGEKIAAGECNIGRKCCKEENPEEYAKQMQEYKINEILELVDSMEGKTPEEVFDIAEKIKAVYDSIKEKVEK